MAKSGIKNPRVNRHEVEQAILNVYDDEVLEFGANARHIFFVVTYKKLAQKLKTSRYQIQRVFNESFEDFLVKQGRGFFWYGGPPYNFRFFYGLDIDEYFDDDDSIFDETWRQVVLDARQS